MFMAFELIPFPISMLFVAAFGLAWIAVLYKLRERGKIYSILFWVSLMVGVLVFVLFLVLVMLG